MKEADGAYILRRWLEQDEAVRGLVQNVSRHRRSGIYTRTCFLPFAVDGCCCQCGVCSVVFPTQSQALSREGTKWGTVDVHAHCSVGSRVTPTSTAESFEP